MKTAVEWLVEQVNSAKWKFSDVTDKNAIIEQAKEMEKNYIAQAFEDGDHNYFYSKKTGYDFENGKQYYNEKFEKNGN
jgi:hypothetical protein